MLSLLRFVAPTIAMMLLMGLYTLVDTVFAARFINTDALSAINIVCPVNYLSVGLGTMLAAGGNAVVSREMGAGNEREAKEDFTLIVIAGAVIGFLMLAAGMLWCRQLIEMLGAGELLFPYCKDYLEILLLFIPANILQTIFSNLFVTAGKPGLGFGLSVLAGLANIVLDYVFIVIFDLGIRGAALGTGCSCLIPAVTGIVFFARSRGVLSFVRPRKRWRILKESCFNGSSEMVGQMASAVTTFLFNRTMMRLLGEDGVAAITILIYAQFLLNTLLTGYFGGLADEVLMRINDALTAFPSILLALVVISILGPGNKYNVIIALGLVFIPSFARISRTAFAALRDVNYVKSARLMGAGNGRILLVHMLPNTMSVLLPAVTIGFNNAVLAEASMSFLGIGVKPPDASLGYMLSEAQGMLLGAPWYAVSVGITIVLLVFSVGLIGEGLLRRDKGVG